MTYEELKDALDGLRAYDRGAADSGIHDELLRVKCIKVLKDQPLRPGQLWPDVLSRIVADLCFADEQAIRRYGCEDAYGFMDWLVEEMEMPQL
jgi:hypothetical protein